MIPRFAKARSCPKTAARKSAAAKDSKAVDDSSKQCFSSLCPPTPEQSAELAACMPQLEGLALQPPHFHETDWKIGQRFSQEDDPDRTAEPWAAPPFVHTRDPTELRAKLTVEEIVVPDGVGYMDGSFARMIHGVLDPQDCAALIRSVNRKGFTPALLNIGGGRQSLTPDARDGHRVIVDSEDLSAWLLEVLRPHLALNRHELVEMNERCRILCYTPGQEFPMHCDGQFRKPAGQKSFVTVQLYLNDVPESHGGATTFQFGGFGNECKLPCQPRAGSVLLFTQDLMHEGSLLSKGIKYTLRTEAMYTLTN